MPKKGSADFSTRQVMIESDYEIYHYRDNALTEVAPHSHDYYEMYFFLGGDIDYILDNHLYRLQKGDIILIPPNTLHHPLIQDSEISYERIVLWISYTMWNKLSILDPNMEYCIKNNTFDLFLIRMPDSLWHGLYGKLLELLSDYNNENFCRLLNGYGIIATILTQLNRTIRQELIQTSTAHSLLTDILQYIQSNLEEELTLDDLSKKFLVSKYHISHMFKKKLSISFYQYVIKCRLMCAKNKIINDEPINKLYESCGFSDYSCFFRAFKKEYGISPREFKSRIHTPR